MFLRKGSLLKFSFFFLFFLPNLYFFIISIYVDFKVYYIKFEFQNLNLEN